MESNYQLPLFLKGVPTMEAKILNVTAEVVTDLRKYNRCLVNKFPVDIIHYHKGIHACTYRTEPLSKYMHRIFESALDIPELAIHQSREGSATKKAYVTFVCEEKHAPVVLKLARYLRCLSVTLVHSYSLTLEKDSNQFVIDPDTRMLGYCFCSQDRTRNKEFFQLMDSALLALIHSTQ